MQENLFYLDFSPAKGSIGALPLNSSPSAWPSFGHFYILFILWHPNVHMVLKVKILQWGVEGDNHFPEPFNWSKDI